MKYFFLKYKDDKNKQYKTNNTQFTYFKNMNEVFNRLIISMILKKSRI